MSGHTVKSPTAVVRRRCRPLANRHAHENQERLAIDARYSANLSFPCTTPRSMPHLMIVSRISRDEYTMVFVSVIFPH